MMGLLLWKEPREGRRERAVTISDRAVLRMRFTCGEVLRGPKTPEPLVRRRVRRAAKQLRKLGVTQAVLPEPFPYREELAKLGIRPVSTLPLRRALAADWARAVLTSRGLSPGSARVAVAGEQLTGELVRTVTELALGCRYVLLDLPYGGEELCRQLRREYGVSLLMGPSRDQLEGADVLVLFAPREDLKRERGVTLTLYEGGEEALPPLLLPPALEEQLPAGCHRGQLLAVLREAGAIRTSQITVAAEKAGL